MSDAVRAFEVASIQLGLQEWLSDNKGLNVLNWERKLASVVQPGL